MQRNITMLLDRLRSPAGQRAGRVLFGVATLIFTGWYLLRPSILLYEVEALHWVNVDARVTVWTDRQGQLVVTNCNRSPQSTSYPVSVEAEALVFLHLV
jgi:hypothetical protein